MPFTPPNGQCCANCLAGSDNGMRCWRNAAHGEPGKLLVSSGNLADHVPWCLHWRASRDVRCLDCRWFGEPDCPHALLVNDVRTNIVDLEAYPNEEAFACQEWEAKD